jgi:hypothetical protein
VSSFGSPSQLVDAELAQMSPQKSDSVNGKCSRRRWRAAAALLPSTPDGPNVVALRNESDMEYVADDLHDGWPPIHSNSLRR